MIWIIFSYQHDTVLKEGYGSGIELKTSRKHENETNDYISTSKNIGKTMKNKEGKKQWKSMKNNETHLQHIGKTMKHVKNNSKSQWKCMRHIQKPWKYMKNNETNSENPWKIMKNIEQNEKQWATS